MAYSFRMQGCSRSSTDNEPWQLWIWWSAEWEWEQATMSWRWPGPHQLNSHVKDIKTRSNFKRYEYYYFVYCQKIFIWSRRRSPMTFHTNAFFFHISQDNQQNTSKFLFFSMYLRQLQCSVQEWQVTGLPIWSQVFVKLLLVLVFPVFLERKN